MRDVAGFREDVATWPLHVKNVGTVNLDGLLTIPTAGPDSKRFFAHAVGWIRDPSRYNAMPLPNRNQFKAPFARLSSDDVELMHQAKQVRVIHPHAARGGVKLFPVAEAQKQRRRAIKHTADINDCFGRDTLQKVNLPSRLDQSLQSRSGKFAITLDFAAWFDQFPLHDEIGDRMCFVAGGRTFALTRMPMGQRQAVEVAQGATSVLLDFELPFDVSVQSCIDNVRFVGPKDAIIAAATQFVQRSRSVGCTFNELPSANSPEEDEQQLRALVHQEGDWLGATYDYDTARQRVTEKTINKLNMSWDHRSDWTLRSYAAHMGLLFFATSVLRLNVGRHFESMKQFRLRSSAVTQGSLQWSSSKGLAFSPAEWADLGEWTTEVLQNVWVECHDGSAPERVIATDASEWGYGAIYLDLATGMVDQCGVAWTETDRARQDMSHSAYAEPEAVYRALCRFIKPSDQRPVMVLTDSSTAKYAIEKAYSPSFVVNCIARKCRDRFPTMRIDIHHVAGTLNGADQLSRNGPLVAAPEQVVRRMMGVIKIQ